MEFQSRRIFQLILLSAVMLTPVCAGARQSPLPSDLQDKPITLSAKDVSLADAADAVAKQIGRNVVIDDEPALKTTDLDLNCSAKEALDKIGDRFDYEWRLSKQGIILMTKRFKDPNAVPQINLPEMRQMVKEANSAMKLIVCDTVPGKWALLCTPLYESLSMDQKQLLQSGGSVNVSDLYTTQYRALEQIELNRRFAEAIHTWRFLQAELDSLSASYLQTRDWPEYYQRQGRLPADVRTPKSRDFGYFFRLGGEERHRNIHSERLPR